MTPSSTALIAFAALAGYPLIQIAAIWLRRPLRLEFNGLVAAMRADPAYQGDAEQKALAGLMEASRGSPIIALAPVVYPLIVVADLFVAAEPMPRLEDRVVAQRLADGVSALDGLPGASPLWADPRMHHSLILSHDLSFANWPLTLLLTAIVTSPIALVVGIVGWLRRRTVDFSPRLAALRLSRVFQAMVQT